MSCDYNDMSITSGLLQVPVHVYQAHIRSDLNDSESKRIMVSNIEL